MNSLRNFVGAFGSPGEVLETLTSNQKLTNFGELICQMNYGLMPYDWARESMTLFAKEVLPKLKQI